MNTRARDQATSEVRPCLECRKGRKRRECLDYDHRFTYEGRSYSVRISQLPVIRCNNCEAVSFDQQALQIIDDAECHRLHLLRPAEIVERREQIALTQRQLAKLLGVGLATLVRWEKGHFRQSRSLDNLLRLVLFHEDCRRILSKEQEDAERLGQQPYCGHLPVDPAKSEGPLDPPGRFVAAYLREAELSQAASRSRTFALRRWRSLRAV
jgi:putative zinc finger/helix-turn-helix YgiT family protein